MEPAQLTLIRVIDTETTSLENAQVCEIGWTDLRLFPDGWAIEDGPRSKLCGVTVPIEPEARAAHHITDEELEGKPSFQDVLPKVLSGVDYLCAHNAEFDSQFFKGSATPWLCTFKIATALWPEFPSHGNQAIRYRRGYEFADISKTLPAHRAGPDAYVTAHIMLDALTFEGVNEKPYSFASLLSVSQKPRRMRVFKFGKHRGELLADVPSDYLEWIVEKSDMDEAVKWNCQRELALRTG